MPHTARLQRRILRDFPQPGSAAEILAALDRMAAETTHSRDYFESERVKAAIVLLANGSATEFRRAVNLAKRDWRDVLVDADLASEDWPARLDAELGPPADDDH
ncbi:hypothetical protein [Nocardia pseudobrasiliensis]|uniref:Uncharacterized protein n=1 Tax=Nocardia pseudobrasiliensis TaxID=45979 RepID=A0A370HN50_9NOCA|nr:hypothetical protein [Nocardia pseudobrasiliensis]RDI59655.1 hypothetical protein DFR76_11846 [Nocardia pseudobrasiliensis]